jgi:hypothetical protein
MVCSARTVPNITLALITARNSERQGRVIDAADSSSMEGKRRESHF